MTTTPTLSARRIGAECQVRVAGRGTMCESPAFQAFVTEALDVERCPHVVVDLCGCEYLDSTFLGCLVSLHKHYNREGTARVAFEAPPAVRDKLLGATRLDRVLNLTDSPPEGDAEWLPIPAETLDSRQLARHIMQCHRELAEVGGPSSAAFNSIAQRLAQELGEKTP